MEYYSGLPLFPLSTVLFPGQILRLRVFEKRYLKMVEDCLNSDRTFGVALIRRGREVGAPAEPHPVGVTSRIMEVNRLDDGTLDLVCAGKKRFVIHSVSGIYAYLSCDAELWPWIYSPERDVRFAASLQAELRAYLETISKIVGGAFPVPQALPADTFNLACLTGISLKVHEYEKQKLLSTETLEEMAKDCQQILRRENLLLNSFKAFPDGLVEQMKFYSPN